jgi:endonuclease G
MKKIIQTLFSLLLFQALAFGQQEVKTNDGRTVLLYDDGTWLYADSIPLYNIKATNITNLEIPKTNPRDKIITHTGYSLLYNEKHEQASWVAYDLTKEETNKLYERTNKFIIDPKVRKGSANDRDYEGSGYDRGHLAPASDMGWSSTTMAESFYYSNMSPQTPSFNRGIWKKLEELVRSWAIENNSVYVITGPVLTDDLETIGPNEVSIPNYYYKVILDYSEPNIKGIGFILPNTGSKEPLQTYAVSIDSVEKVTGINFFPLLEDDQEELIENTLCVKCWSWMNTKSANKKNENNENKVTESTQCNGITKAGQRCKRKTLNASGYCYSHETQLNGDDSKSKTEENCSKPTYSGSTSTQCTGTTKKGSRCRRMTSSSSGRCYQH